MSKTTLTWEFREMVFRWAAESLGLGPLPNVLGSFPPSLGC